MGVGTDNSKLKIFREHVNSKCIQLLLIWYVSNLDWTFESGIDLNSQFTQTIQVYHMLNHINFDSDGNKIDGTDYEDKTVQWIFNAK